MHAFTARNLEQNTKMLSNHTLELRIDDSSVSCVLYVFLNILQTNTKKGKLYKKLKNTVKMRYVLIKGGKQIGLSSNLMHHL